MPTSFPDNDAYSDELIGIFTADTATSAEREKAAHNLYKRHAQWVEDQICLKIYNPEDVKDIAQTVWIMLLNPESLRNTYAIREGKFRAFLRKPIRWSILKHLDKLPFIEDKNNGKSSPIFIDIDEEYFDTSIDSMIFEDTINTIIKPNLSQLDLKPRITFVANDYDTLFQSQASPGEVAQINGMTQTVVNTLLAQADVRKCPTDFTDQERSVYIPTHYRRLVDPEELDVAAGRHLAKIIGISEAIFRKQLHLAKKQLIEIVRHNAIFMKKSDTDL